MERNYVHAAQYRSEPEDGPPHNGSLPEADLEEQPSRPDTVKILLALVLLLAMTYTVLLGLMPPEAVTPAPPPPSGPLG
ncbi:hypothetical protein HNR42_000327 [Deinobacterium chartae]|uniref:Uncharacterized protein n=1 Tax=Deinobacterium chartae TaxID=521158 RepID=A0A841HYR6_9DEIO|nr:hypothetical protein [Deinobacterium chartae]MBB6096915.1 hypothetical protein [Deinobacterium chartae]